MELRQHGPQAKRTGRMGESGPQNKLPFGVSIHSSHAWTWYETAQGADKKGPYAGISYDARVVTKEDGKGNGGKATTRKSYTYRIMP